MIILKIGGSVITDKSKERVFKKLVMDNLSEVIKKSNEKLILVHGAGSFGHIQAKRYDLNSGFKNKDQKLGFSLTHKFVQELNSYVLESLQRYNIAAVSIAPHSVLKLDRHKLSYFNVKIFEDYIKSDFTPVCFGDVVLDKSMGFSICSGDLLVLELTKYFKPEKVIFALDEDGIFSTNPKKDKNAKLISSITSEDLEKLRTSQDSHADVTGGMSGKIKTIKAISDLGFDTILLNGNKADRLFEVLTNKETTSTIVYGDKK